VCRRFHRCRQCTFGLSDQSAWAYVYLLQGGRSE